MYFELLFSLAYGKISTKSDWNIARWFLSMLIGLRKNDDVHADREWNKMDYLSVLHGKSDHFWKILFQNNQFIYVFHWMIIKNVHLRWSNIGRHCNFSLSLIFFHSPIFMVCLHIFNARVYYTHDIHMRKVASLSIFLCLLACVRIPNCQRVEARQAFGNVWISDETFSFTNFTVIPAS